MTKLIRYTKGASNAIRVLEENGFDDLLDYSLDLFAYAPENMTTLFGAASSVLLSDSIVFNAESALVRAERENLLSDESAYKSWNARVSANIVWTLEGGIELIGEVSHAGDAIGRSQWRQVRNSIDPNVISRLNEFRTTRSRMSEPLVKDGYFTSANWRDAFGRQGLDLSVFATGNFYDASLLWQTSITQDFKRGTSAGLIASGFEGTPTSEFGSSPLETYIAVFVGKTF